jgi:hypothetical protein
MFSQNRARPLTTATIVAALLLAGAFTALDIVPAASQDTLLRAWSVESSQGLMDPWSGVWSDVKPSVVALSAQNATKPFGGGEVATLKARALQDGDTLYVHLEWKDGTRDESVNGQTVFGDSAAIELPVVPGVAVPSFCMGDANGTVNIWHWKAVWQADLESGYSSVRDRYPDGFADGYLLEDDPAFQTARAAGNILSQEQHASPVENLVAAAFGTLTTADLQDVDGGGAWKDGRWRVVFARPLSTASGYPSLAAGDSTNIAFAVWDGSKGNRDGIKSVSQFMNLLVSGSPVPENGGGFPWWGWLIAAGVVLTFTASAATAIYAQGGRSR